MGFNPNIRYNPALSFEENLKAAMNWLNFAVQEMSVGRVPEVREAASGAAAVAERAQSAASIAFVTLAESGDVDAVTAGEHTELFAEWTPDAEYAAGALRRYGDRLYRCLQSHTAQSDWTPDAVANLWKEAADPAEEWPAWAQPVGAADAYAAGDKVSHGGTRWISSIDANVWEPGVYGWEEALT